MFIINTYRKGTPLWKVLLENCIYRVRVIINFLKNGFKNKTILFYPEYPTKRSVAYKIFRKLNYNITNNPNQPFDIAISWENTTFKKAPDLLRELIASARVLNINCNDISKENVDNVFNQVFGYGLIINPLEYEGKCVKKNDLNAKHDGIIIECPVQRAEKGFVYQKIVNNEHDDFLVQDIRAPVFEGKIPFVYLKYRSIQDRFNNTNERTSIAEVHDILTTEEVKRISLFCQSIGLDYGELDVLRDNDNGQIYIVDVSNTPWGPPNKISKKEGKIALTKLADTFREGFL